MEKKEIAAVMQKKNNEEQELATREIIFALQRMQTWNVVKIVFSSILVLFIVGILYLPFSIYRYNLIKNIILDTETSGSSYLVTTKDTILTWTILSFFFAGVISFVLFILAYTKYSRLEISM